MPNTLVTLKHFLHKRQLTRKNNGVPLAETRQRLEQSHLLKTMRDIRDAINSEAGTVIVDEHHYLPPEPVISSFVFARGQTEYVMRLELSGPRPSLVFITRKWRDTSPNGLFRWIYRFAELEPLSISLKFTSELQEESVSREELKRCFYYLLSGLSRSYTPSFRFCKDPPKGTVRE
jgi:hypothetical protein